MISGSSLMFVVVVSVAMRGFVSVIWLFEDLHQLLNKRELWIGFAGVHWSSNACNAKSSRFSKKEVSIYSCFLKHFGDLEAIVQGIQFLTPRPYFMGIATSEIFCNCRIPLLRLGMVVVRVYSHTIRILTRVVSNGMGEDDSTRPSRVEDMERPDLAFKRATRRLILIIDHKTFFFNWLQITVYIFFQQSLSLVSSDQTLLWTSECHQNSSSEEAG